jgi:hypothetical protein
LCSRMSVRRGGDECDTSFLLSCFPRLLRSLTSVFLLSSTPARLSTIASQTTSETPFVHPPPLTYLFNMSNPKCEICSKTVYPLEKISASDKAFHKWCFKCRCPFFHLFLHSRPPCSMHASLTCVRVRVCRAPCHPPLLLLFVCQRVHLLVSPYLLLVFLLLLNISLSLA